MFIKGVKMKKITTGILGIIPEIFFVGIFVFSVLIMIAD